MSHFAVLGGIGRPTRSLGPAAGQMRALLPDAAEDLDDHLLQLGCIARHGPLSICGDLGLTDLAQLRAAANADSDATPAQLILSLWARYQERALDRLHGSFAFVLRDAASQEVWAVRDRMGVRPLVYAHAPDRFVVGSTIGLVRAALSGPTQIEKAWVADFLSGQDTSRTHTIHKEIRRLAPGCLLRVAADGTLTTRLWYSLADRIQPTRTDGAAALHDALHHATQEACAGRKIATFLSGGLDSSTLSLLSVGGGDERAALSLRYKDPALDEGAYIAAVLQKAGGGLVPHNIPAEDVRTDWQTLLANRDQPIFAPGLPGSRHLYAVARQMGYRDVLDGHGGDEVIDGGLWNLGHLAGQGAWTSALTLAWRYARFTGVGAFGVWTQLVAAQGSGPLARLARRSLRSGHDSLEWRVLLDPALVTEADLVARVRAHNAPVAGDFPDSTRAHLSRLTAPLTSGALEILDSAARAEGVTPHYPFYDHRVVELCAAQPDLPRIAGGQPRSLVRRAMRGVLPDKVRLRGGKVDFLPNLWATMQRDPLLRRLLADPQALQGWVNIATLRADAQRLQSSTPDFATAFRISRALALSTWFGIRTTPNDKVS